MHEKLTTNWLDSLPASETRFMVKGDPFDPARKKKIQEREQLLLDSPDLKIGVDAAKLQEILPGSAFVCYSGSSVARGRAIRGSDIDGGIVITHSPTSLEDQKKYVFELRRQGFKVYSPAHVSDVEERALLDDTQLDDQGVTEMQQLRLKVLTFETKNQFEENRRQGKTLVHARFFVVYADD